MGLFGKVVSFGLGVYAGIYYSQNAETCPKVEDPATLLKRLQAYIEEIEKKTNK